MNRLVRWRPLLWVAAVVTVPPALLDFAEWQGRDPSWGIPSTFADVFAPYWLANAILGVPSHGAPPPAQIVLAAMLGAAPFVALHAYVVRLFARRRANDDRAI